MCCFLLCLVIVEWFHDVKVHHGHRRMYFFFFLVPAGVCLKGVLVVATCSVMQAIDPSSTTAIPSLTPSKRCTDPSMGGCRGYFRDPWFALNFLREMWLLLFNPREPWFAYYRDPWFQIYFPRYPWKRPHFRRENNENFRKMSVLLTIFNEK